MKRKSRTLAYSDLYGLVLSGGKSTRMGRDKGTIAYHGKPHRDYLYELLNTYCASTYLSIRADQRHEVREGRNLILDTDEFRGPFNGLLSAHARHPDKAWLVLACDLPLLDGHTLERLIDARDTGMDATSLATKASGLPEPLAAIWEPGGLMKARSHMESSDNSCPRKFLIRIARTKLVHPSDDQVLYNANSLSEYEEIQAKLSSS